jgi:hypothetical protein
MGQAQTNYGVPSSEYTLFKELPNGSIVKDSSKGKLHFLKEYSYTNQ